MKTAQSQRPEDRSLSSVIQELFNGFQNLIKSEVTLIRAELTDHSKKFVKHMAFVIGFGVMALLGILPFVAFLCIGLGRLLGDNYWLSSLIVSIVLTTIGGIVGYRFARSLREQDLTLPHTRNSLQNETQMMKDKVQEISDAIKRRAS